MSSQDFTTFLINLPSDDFTVANMLEFNRLVAILPTRENNEANEAFFNNLGYMETDIRKIKKKSFGWNKERAKNLESFFLHFKQLKGMLYLEFGNNEYLMKRLPVEFFMLYFSVNYGETGSSKHYEETIRLSTLMLNFFNNSIFLKDYIFMPQLPSKSCFLFDPIFRQRVREVNRADERTKQKYFSSTFNLKEFCFLCIERFFPNVGWRWTGNNHTAHVETLVLIVKMFEYGLWEPGDIDRILISMYAISEIMFNLENYLQIDSTSVDVKSYYDEQIAACTMARELVASVFLHIILIYLDEDVTYKLPAFNSQFAFNDGGTYEPPFFDPINVKSLFKYSTFNKNKLYTYFSYILVTYLGRYKPIKAGYPPVKSDNLSFYLSLLFTYISDINGDFYKISIKMMKAKYFPFYFLKQENDFTTAVLEFKSKFDLIINDIKLQAYGQLNSDYAGFLNRLVVLFKEVSQFLNSDEDPSLLYRTVITKKILLSLYNLPHYILSLMRLIIELDREPSSTFMAFGLGLNLIKKIGTENYPGFNQMFTGYNLKNMESLYKAKFNEMNTISRELVVKSETLPLIEYNPDILNLNIGIYKDLISSFLEEYNRIGPENNYGVINSKFMISLYNFNGILNTLIESFVSKRSKYELYLAEILLNIIPVAFQVISLVEVTPENQRFTDFWKTLQEGKNSFLTEIGEWDILENDMKRILILELMRSFIEVYNRSTSRFYTYSNLSVVKDLFETNYQLQNFFKLLDCEAGVRLMTQIVRLYSNFMIFRQNHLINRRFDEFGDLETQTTEITLSDYLLERETLQEILGLKNHALKYIETSGMNFNISKFCFCAYFPLLFKYYSGLLSMFIFEDHKSLKREFERTLDALSEIMTFVVFVDTKLTEQVEKGSDNNRMPHKYKKELKVDNYLMQFVNLFELHESEYFYDESTRNNIFRKRQKGYLFLKSLLEVYRHHNRKKLHLEKYIRFDPYQAHKKIATIMKKKLRFNYMYRKKQNLLKDEVIDETVDLTSTDPTAILKLIDKLYESTKTYFFENPEKNQCFKVLKTSDVLKNNLEYYIDYFFTELDRMDLEFNKLTDNIFTNSNFISLILMMDNLIKISDTYRKTFYNILTQKVTTNIDEKVMKKVMKNIWDLHKMLYYLTLYKTFFDRDWAEVYTLYYLISNFLQNLCEDNFVGFKIWFHENTMIKDDGKSLFLYYFSMFEAAFHNSKIHKNRSPRLMLSDKPELFPILNRLTIGMTEFINGGAVRTQFEIYRYKIDVWVGIILRIIDDVDSMFYELKDNILTYILGLTEGYDPDVINFMATNFPITRLYNLIFRLTKKLFVRQMLLKAGTSEEKEASMLDYRCYRISEQRENQFKIKSKDDLLDFYKKYEKSFSDHTITGVIIKTYNLMRDLSVRVVRYENFLIEKREDIKKFIKNEHATSENLEPLFVWYFLKKIIVDIEIAYRDINVEDQTDQPPIRLFYFKKLPESFFLTDEAKSEFRTRVNINSREEKHEQFFNEFDQYDIVTKDLKRLYSKSKTLFNLATEQSFFIFMIILYIIALAINIILLVFYDKVGQDFENERGNLKVTKLVLSIILTVLSFLFGVFWFMVKYRTVQKINWENYYLINPRESKPKLIEKLKINIYDSIVREGVIQTFILHFIFSLLGLLVNPFFYTILLLLIIHLSLVVYNVALSFIDNYDKLFFTLLIIVVVINSFSFLTIQFFRSNFSEENIGDEYMSVCKTYFSCLMNGINIGLRSGGGISDNFTFQSDGTASVYIGRLIFDVLFFIMVNLILLGIFFGIIVDSFKALRDEMSKRKKDEHEVCFTCDLNRVTLERKGIDFDLHMKIHDIWNYFFYVQYLRWKPENDYDGIDIYVHNLIQRQYNTSWLPHGQTIALENAYKRRN